MTFLDITKISETDDLTEVNVYLELGWKLLHIYETTYETDDPNVHNQVPHFILGWPKGATEPPYPEYDSDDPVLKILSSRNSD